MSDKIVVDRISKRFRRWDPHRAMTLQEMFQCFRILRRSGHFWALSDVSFQVPAGRMVGVIGSNGAGKSTLLNLVAGVGRATSGHIELTGRVGAILELGVGFHSELSGRENVFVSGVTSGLTRREVSERFDSIVAFSELEEFIGYPLRTYSSGMRLRLAFAVASHIEPEVLLIDEVLAVGDIGFQKKCLDRLSSFQDHGCTGLIVSHDPDLVERLCDDVIWLDHGRLKAYGPVDEIMARYIESTNTLPKEPEPSLLS